MKTYLLSISVVLFVIFVNYSSRAYTPKLYFELNGGQKKCFLEEHPRDTMLLGRYFLEDLNPPTAGMSPQLALSVNVLDPEKKEFLSKTMGPEGRFAFTTLIGGEYQICFHTNTSRWFGPSVRTRLYLDIEAGAGANDYDEIAKVEHLNNLEVSLRRLNDRVNQIRKEQSYQRNREIVFRNTSESTNSRVMWWSFIQVAVLVLSGVWQMRHLKSFFRAKKLKKELGEWGVDSVQIVSGHIAIRFQMSRSVALFDATIAKHQLNESIQRALEQTLSTKQFLNSPSSSSGSSGSGNNNNNTSLPILACTFPNSIVKFGFDKSTLANTTPSSSGSNNQKIPPTAIGRDNQQQQQQQQEMNPLRFYVFESDGTFHLWEWISSEFKWRYIVKVYLPLVPTLNDVNSSNYTSTSPFIQIQPVTISYGAVFSTTQGQAVVWIIQNTVYLRVFNFEIMAKKRDVITKQVQVTTIVNNNSNNNGYKQQQTTTTLSIMEELYPQNLRITGLESYEMKKECIEYLMLPTTRIITSKLGLWFITNLFVLHWAFRNKLWYISYIKNKINSNNNNNSQQQNYNQFKSNTTTSCEIHDFHQQQNNNDESTTTTNSSVPSSPNILSNGNSSPLAQSRDDNLLNSNNHNNNRSRKSIENCINDILAACISPASQELLVLETSGRLFSLETAGEKEKLKLNLLSVIHPTDFITTTTTSNNNNNIDQPIFKNNIKIAMHQNAFIVFDQKNSFFYDLKCGKLLSTIQLPVSNFSNSSNTCGLWENGTAGVVWGTGIWVRSEGLWEIRSLPPSNIIQNISTHKIVLNNSTANPTALNNNIFSNLQQKNQPTIGCAPATCKQWDMKRLESKYLLEMALNEQDEELKIQICKSLLGKLENPSLVIAILSTLQSESCSKFILEELSSFLEHYDYQQNLLDGNNNVVEDEKLRNLKIRNSFLYHTPLNQKMIPLLKEYYQLQKNALQESAPSQPILDGGEEFQLSTIPDSMILNVGPELIEIFKRKNPGLLLEKLESCLGLSSIDYPRYSDLYGGEMVPFPTIDQVLLQPEETLKKPEVDPLKKRLDEQLLMINPVTGGSGFLQPFYPSYPLFETLCQLYYSERPQSLLPFVRIVHNAIAIQSLPICLPLPHEDEKIEARYKLLMAVGHRPNALRLLLTTGKWDKAVKMVKVLSYSDKEAFILYEILLSFCIEKKDNVKLKQCWDIIPKNFSVFNLLSLLKPNQSIIKNNISSIVNNSNNINLDGSTASASTSLTQNNPVQILSTSPHEDLVVDMFRGQLLKMLSVVNK
eukprot:gene897-1122_t